MNNIVIKGGGNNLLKVYVFIHIVFSLGCKIDDSGNKNEFPNIIIMLADDLGYGDLACYGGDAHTPNLDQLAKEGMRFTDFYAAASNCSPSRTGLLTGRSPSMVGVYNYIPPVHPMHLRGEEVTLAEILKQAGYRTGHFGKWHLSNLDSLEMRQPSPEDQGFDHSLGTTNNARPSHLNPINYVRNGKPTGIINGYSCDIVVEEALQWLHQKPESDVPFFMYLAFHEPHKVVASPPELVAKYDFLPRRDAEYLANVENMDEAIGRLLETLSEEGLLENTFILFASDNGSYRNGSNGPLLGGKSFVYEGGIRVPGIIYWKGHIDPGQTITEVAGLIDVMPTLCDIVELDHPSPELLAGVSLTPIISGKLLRREKPLSWFFYRTSPEMAMRVGDYTILGKSGDTSKHTHKFTKPDMDHIRNLKFDEFELYDLSKDIGQEKKIEFTSIDQGVPLKEMIVSQLKEIQMTGFYWNTLPPATAVKRLKSEWRQLRPEGFSN